MIDNQKHPENNWDNIEKNLESSEELERKDFVTQEDNVILEMDSESMATETALETSPENQENQVPENQVPENQVPENQVPENLPENQVREEIIGENFPEKTESVPDDGVTEAKQVIEVMQKEIATLKQNLTEQIEKTESFKTQYLRIAADFDNFRKRTHKEQENLERQVKRNTINELLSVVDNFERARSQLKPANDGEMAIHKSYQGVYKNLVDSLKRIGVSAMRPEGKQFDPNYHEAMLREPTDEYPDGTVIEQLVRGYLLGDQVLCHAMVKVAAPKEEKEDQMVDSVDSTDSTEESDSQEKKV